MPKKTIEHFKGCIIGGAIGDALGAPIEFLSIDQIRSKYGDQGLTDYSEVYGQIGAGWVAEEALGISLYSSLAAENDFKKGVLLSVNHSGDSDSTGSITGNILGAIYGVDIIPENWVANLELKELIAETANDLFDQY